MKIKFFLLAAFAAILFFLLGCRKDKKDDNTIPIEYGQLKDYVYFKTGTYWIYEDKHGNVDSMYVFDYQEGTLNNHQYFSSTIRSTYDSYNYFVEWNTSWTSYSPTRHKVFMKKIKPGDYVGQIILMEFPPVAGNILYFYNDNDITTTSFYESYLVDSLKFYSVIEMHESKDITNFDQETNYFIARNFGIIKEELLDSNNVWKLKRYNIVQ